MPQRVGYREFHPSSLPCSGREGEREFIYIFPVSPHSPSRAPKGRISASSPGFAGELYFQHSLSHE